MTASLSRSDRLARSCVNVAANRLIRDEATFGLAAACIRRQILRREGELGRELLLPELETLCDSVTLQDLVAHILAQPR